MSNMSASGELSIKSIVREVLTYRSGQVGAAILLFLIGLSIYAVIAIPYDRAIALWRGEESCWIEVPRNAMPYWYKYIMRKNLPETIVVDGLRGDPGVIKAVTEIPGTNIKRILLEISFTYDYDDFPSEVNLFFYANYSESLPLIKIYWVKPDGSNIPLISYTIRRPYTILYLTINDDVQKSLLEFVRSNVGEPKEYIEPQLIMFAVNDETMLSAKTAKILKSTGSQIRKYTLRIEGMLFGKDSDLNAKLVVYGKVYGFAGTDHLRRDVSIALLWGTPIALAFGLTSSLAISIVQLIIAVISGWYGGKVDFIIQRLTEIYMIIPFLPFLIMISSLYRLTIWVLVAVLLVLSIFGAGVKSTRALVMQVKEEPYIEAALAYGASSRRIIFLYIIPKILPPMIPGLIGSVPGFVFLEASLAFLGLGDPFLPTWGKVINDAFSNGAFYKGYLWWIGLPSIMLILTAISFALIGFALDKIVNPRLREW